MSAPVSAVESGLVPYEMVAARDREIAALNATLDHGRRFVLDMMLSQCGWEDDEDIVTLNGEPVGGTIARRNRQEFDRWWPSVRAVILTAFTVRADCKEVPDGMAGIRDTDSPCKDFLPIASAKTGEIHTTCDGDGHYLCRSCACFNDTEGES